MLKTIKLLVTFILLTSLIGCSTQTASKPKVPIEDKKIKNFSISKTFTENVRTCYSLFPISFSDSNNDGYGDLKGIQQKLDYLKELGIQCIYLNPIQPSPSYHKYDVVDYYGVDPKFGTMQDFENLVKSAKEKNIKIIMDMVFNHTSIQNPWFQKAIKGDKKYKDYYIFNDGKDKEFPLNGPWYRAGKQYYHAFFWEGMPDLNLDNENVRNEIYKISKFWLDKGADGFRLDAAAMGFEPSEYKRGTNVLGKNVNFWKEYTSEVKKNNPDAFVIAEVWKPLYDQKRYYESYDSMFNFDGSDQIMHAVKTGTAFDFDSFFSKEIEGKKLADGQRFIDSLFISNHDQNRVVSQLNGNLDQAKLAASIYLTMPGLAFVYYGEELGMFGEKPDEQIREPFKWNSSLTDGTTKWEPIRLNKDLVPLDEQRKDPNSMFSHYKKLISIRNNNEAFNIFSEYSVGSYNEWSSLSYFRESKNQKVLVIHNIEADTIKIDLKEKVINNLFMNNANLNKSTLTLKGYGSIILEVQK
ncbi:alpha-amylase family glycosyl hydrolase [Bacillus sp. EAC]|uniref:alpha-amylase family glycosyl hydrolase n=1 Tax=Bacillus sp. EAC TaxID=1978338 RepID=UPI000B43D3EA|nr:alpha-amylase family glycosyl hydrolase [Bacillus sp. EAC]